MITLDEALAIVERQIGMLPESLRDHVTSKKGDGAIDGEVWMDDFGGSGWYKKRRTFSIPLDRLEPIANQEQTDRMTPEDYAWKRILGTMYTLSEDCAHGLVTITAAEEYAFCDLDGLPGPLITRQGNDNAK